MAAVEQFLLKVGLDVASRGIRDMRTLSAEARRLRGEFAKIQATMLRGDPVSPQVFRRVEAASRRATASVAGLAKELRRVEVASRTSGRTLAAFQRTGRALSGTLSRLAGQTRTLAFSMVFLGSALLRVSTSMAKTGSAVLGAERAFKQTSKAIGQTSDALLGNLKRASQGTISDFGLMSAANFAFLAGAKLTSKELDILTRASVKLAAIGIRTSAGALLDAEEIFNRFTQGIVKQERRIVDDMTVVIRAKEVFKEFGAAALVAAGGNEQLARVIAFKKAIVEAASDRLETLRDVDISLVTVGSELTATFQNFVNELGKMFVAGGFATQMVDSLQGILGKMLERLKGPEGEEFFRGIVRAVSSLIPIMELLARVVIIVADNIERIVAAFVGLQIGSVVAALAPALALIPGAGVFLAAGASAAPFVGAGAGFLFGGNTVSPEEAGRSIGRAVQPSIQQQQQGLARVEDTVRNMLMQGASTPSAELG